MAPGCPEAAHCQPDHMSVARLPAPGSRATSRFGRRWTAARSAPERLHHELGDLHGVERCALAEVVVADEQRETALVVHTLVLPDTADERRVRTGRLQRGRDVRERYSGGVAQQLRGALRREG